MKKAKPTAGKENNIEKVLNSISLSQKAPFGMYVVLVILYIVTCVIVSSTASSKSIIDIFGVKLGVYAIAGIFSAISNICIMFIVVLSRWLTFTIEYWC